jgi:hypothetical protein
MVIVDLLKLLNIVELGLQANQPVQLLADPTVLGVVVQVLEQVEEYNIEQEHALGQTVPPILKLTQEIVALSNVGLGATG